MSVQTVVNDSPAIGQNGQVAYNNNLLTTLSKNVPVDKKIMFGRMVSRVTANDTQCQLPTAATDITDAKKQLGIALVADDIEQRNDSLDPHYAAYEKANILRTGYAFVKVEEAVALSDPVYVRFQNKPEIQTITYSADFQAGDSIDIAINGATVSTDFDTNHATTIAAIKTDIEAAFQGLVQDVTVNATNKTVQITAALDQELTIVPEDVGATTATLATTQSATSKYTRGQFRKSADSTTAALWAQAKWVKAASANGIAIIEVNQ